VLCKALPVGIFPIMMPLTASYDVLLTLLLMCAAFPFLLLVVSQLVQIKSPSLLKETTYESGMEPVGDARIQFDVKFYLYALLFILFDIETIFLYPWAVAMEKVGLFAVTEMLLFLAILTLGLAYAWRKGALRWQ
jgi:NADH:ubiquinone oxidoreductase subunit 3 (subunit A)